MKKIVVASDSFKGSMTSLEVADAVGNGVLRAFPDCKVVKLAMADGGEGTSAAIDNVLRGETVVKTVKDPLDRPVHASYLILPDRKTAVVEIASASGLTLLEPDERNPLLTSTYGTGELIMDALSKGCSRIIVGLGGSATNDAGIGLLSALGFRFMHSRSGDGLPAGATMARVYEIDTLTVPECVWEAEFLLACDVRSPFMGPEGAVSVFARQKGASPKDEIALETGMMNMAEVIMQRTGKDVTAIPGAGAAGGTAGTMTALLDAKICSGADLVIGIAGLDREMAGADLVITGEGCADSQTLTGKLPFKVAQRASAAGVPVVLVCGKSKMEGSHPYFDAVIAVTPPDMLLDEAMKKETASANITDAVYGYLKTCVSL